MIEFITGVPGSGKSYYAIFKIVSIFAKNDIIKNDKKLKLEFSEIDKCLTNINNLDLSKFNEVYQLNFEEFKLNLSQLHDLYKLEVTDDELIQEAKKLNLFNIYIVLDECHNYLSSQDKVLIWWLSYHRHLHHEITLITQNLSLVNSKYKAFSEFFLKAIPASRKLFNTSMKYKLFVDSRMSQKSFVRDVNIPIVKDIFTFYSSGANVKSKNVVYRFIFLIAVFILVIFGIFYYLVNKYSNNDEVKKDDMQVKKVSHKVNKKKAHINIDPFLDFEKKLVTFKKVGVFYIYENSVIFQKIFQRYIKNKLIVVLNSRHIGKYIIKECLVDEKVLIRHKLKTLESIKEKNKGGLFYEKFNSYDNTDFKSIFSINK